MIVRRTQLVLAATFALTMLALLTVFAAGVYGYAAATFDFDVVGGEDVAANAAEQGLTSLRAGMALTLGVALLVVPVVSYLLAGRALRPVREAYAREQRLSDDAAHELRTPLTVLRAVLELAASRPRPAQEYQAAMNTSLEVVAGLERLTTQLLNLARASERAIREDFTPVELADVVAEAITRTTSPAGRGVRLTVHAPAGARVDGNHDLLVTAVANLLSNAIAATTGRGNVEVSVSRNPAKATVRVTDDGVGMDQQQLLRATERFWRADPGADGHGIGLALVEQVARLHRGTLTFTSQPGAGTRAELTLPQGRANRHRLVIDRFLAWQQPHTGRPERS